MAKLALIQKWNPTDHGASSTEGIYLPYLQTKYLVHGVATSQHAKRPHHARLDRLLARRRRSPARAGVSLATGGTYNKKNVQIQRPRFCRT